MKLKSGTLLLALAMSASLLAQAPPAAPQQAAPKQSIPTGIQTLPPPPSEHDSVGADEVVLTIGDVKMTRKQFEEAKQALPPELIAKAAAMGERTFAASFVQLRTLVMQAERDKLNDSPEFKFQRDNLLANMVLQKLQTQAQNISDDQVKAHYAAHQADMLQGTLRGIFVSMNPPAKPGAKPDETPKTRTDDEARARAIALRNKILGGADFATVAKEESDHPGTAEKGGDFGTIRKGQGLPPSLETAVFSLKPQQISEPIKENNGYYIFRMEDAKTVTLDEATASIRNTLQQERFMKAVEGITKSYPVVYNDKYFGPPAPAPGTLGAAPSGGQAPAGGSKPVITGVAPAKPGAAGTPPKPPPAVKKQ